MANADANSILNLMFASLIPSAIYLLFRQLREVLAIKQISFRIYKYDNSFFCLYNYILEGRRNLLGLC